MCISVNKAPFQLLWYTTQSRFMLQGKIFREWNRDELQRNGGFNPVFHHHLIET